MFRPLILAAVALGGLTMGAQSLAHHSTAAFDMTKSVALSGTVKAYQWTNPHSYIQVTVPDGKGGKREWAIEAGAPELGLRMGWTKKTLKVGDKVKLTVVPLKSGVPGQAILKSCTLANGKVLYGPGYRPKGGGPPPPQ